MKRCPLKQDLMLCSKEDCGWWDHMDKCCCIVTMAQILEDIKNIMVTFPRDLQ